MELLEEVKPLMKDEHIALSKHVKTIKTTAGIEAELKFLEFYETAYAKIWELRF